MHTHSEKAQDNKGQSGANRVASKQQNNGQMLPCADNRPEAATQLKIKTFADNSEKLKQLNTFHKTLKNSARAHTLNQLHSTLNSHVHSTIPVQQKPKTDVSNKPGPPSQKRVSVKSNMAHSHLISAAFASANQVHSLPTNSKGNARNNHSSNSKPVVQRAKKNIIVTGVSHLVKMNDKSLHASNVEKEIHHGQELVIDTSTKVKSRRGPNQEDYKDIDAQGEHIYRWYKVVSVEGKPEEDGYYIREDVFVDVENEKGKGKLVKGFDTANTVVDEITKVPAKLIGNDGVSGVADALNDKTVFTNTSSDGGPAATVEGKKHAANMGIVGDSITGVTGLLGMANGFVSLGDPEATTADLIEKALDIEQGAMKTGEAVSKLVHTASGSSDPTTASKFGSTFEGYGAAFAGIKEAFMGMRKLVELINEYQDYSTPEKTKAAGEIAVHALESAKSIVLSVKAFMELINGSASGQLMAAVPGLDIAISGGKMIMQGYYLIISNNSRREMNTQRNALANNDKETKGKMKEASKNYRKYDAVISNKKKVIKGYEKELANPGKKTNKKKLKKEIVRLKSEIVELEKYEHEISREDVAEFTMATELRDSNKKRVVRQGIHLATEMAKIAGAIATLTGVGALGGGVVKGAAAATDLALPVARIAKQKARDTKASKEAKGKLNTDDILTKGKFYNFDTSKSSVAKSDFRIKQVKYLIRLIVDLVYKDRHKDINDFKKAESYLKATGVNNKKLFAKNGDPQKQISILLSAFQQREL